MFENPNVGQGLADQPSVRMVFKSNPLDTPLFKFNGLFAQISWLPRPESPSTDRVRALRLATASPIPGFTLALLDLCQPKSRGFVSINSPDPLSDPVVNLGTFNNVDDLDLLQAGIQIYLKNINDALQAMDPFYEIIYPPRALLDDPSFVRQFVKDNIACNEHFQSHCKMVDANSPQEGIQKEGVVDSRGRVFGVKHLYVADDSCVPLCMDGSPMATAYLIAANIAEMIVEDNHKKE